ncbi:uncharacterized protein LOC133975531 [Platichthys flesus]|uniref:uncharacterized protein LOC133975531 n=1 Tax=Platichthys flesus TaxID=8260 RepID=UPI002DB9262D|nr:uncharacterized protein LOC133975531 [Platichthys flesus]
MYPRLRKTTDPREDRIWACSSALTAQKMFVILWMCVGVLSTLLPAVGAVECSNEMETQLRLRPSLSSRAGPQLTNCLLECTRMTYYNKLQIQDNNNIRLKDSTDGDLGEYCWSKELKCTLGESFLRAYVVLPMDISAAGHEQLEVIASAPVATKLHLHASPTTIPERCGLRYDVTEHFSTGESETSFCVKLSTQEDILGDSVLRCPPYLVTFWKRGPNQSNQQGDG